MNPFKILYSLLITFSLFSQFRALETNKKSQANQIGLQKSLKTIKDLSENKTKICDGNRLKFQSPFKLPDQHDLNFTFNIAQKQLDTSNVTVTYSDKPVRIYTIFNFTVSIKYQEEKQISNATSVNVLNISGANIKLDYSFKWKKEQIGQTLIGDGTGAVSSDPLSFEKVLVKNDSDTSTLIWKLKTANPITISNLLTLKTISPYRQMDAQIIDKMLNQPKDKKIKSKLTQALNKNFKQILTDVVNNYTVYSVGKNFLYTYNDYRGSFNLNFSNVLVENYLTTNAGVNGLALILSQSVIDDETFECGGKVPVDPDSLSKYGGTQEYISNIFLRSSLKKALKNSFLDVTLSQDSWQSRAFQFYVGDLHEAIESTKNVSSYVQLKAKCQAAEDKVFKFQMKTIESYAVNVNFTCQLNLSQTIKIVDINLPVEYEIQPSITTEALNFVVKSLKGTPTFVYNQKFKIGNPQLASFMLMQTLKMAVNSKVIGSGFKVQSRTNPKLQVRKDYLFLYDKPSNSEQSQL